MNQQSGHSACVMADGGFQSTGDGDTVRCDDCGLEVSNWTSDMTPLIIHSQRRPDCPFVRSIQARSASNIPTASCSPITSAGNPSALETQPNPSKNEVTGTMNSSSGGFDKKNYNSRRLAAIRNQIQSMRKHGVHSNCHMSACGFQYTGNGDTAYCKDCGLEVSNWTLDMKPFTIHSRHRPDCSFVRSIRTSLSPNTAATFTSSITNVRMPSTSETQNNPLMHQEVRRMFLLCRLNTLHETELVQQVRRRTFSHWSHRTSPSSAQMIQAGFFNCNVGDRVICIYCNLICQQWELDTDDPCEVHKKFSPGCKYVKSKLIRPAVSSSNVGDDKPIVNTSDIRSGTATNHGLLRSNGIVLTVSCNPTYSEITKRHASYATWPIEDLPPVDDLVRAGFFYTGTKTIVTCFYCNGSLQNWGPNHNPMIEHARWLPHCAYARQLCGEELYRKIQESKRAQQERARANESNGGTVHNELPNSNTPPPTTNSRQLLIPDESTLSRLVAARLDLPISQWLLDQNFKLSVIKRCWEDQLRLKNANFESECDLYMACLILQKQIEHIDGRKENIVIPNVKMKQIRDQIRVCIRGQTAPVPHPAQTTGDRNQSTLSNPCVLCLTEEKRLACIPCGHLATCVACGHSLRSCPICRREIKAFVRVYVP
ncbi:unnamed protein product [Rotaria magnacalcarata]|uniref:RING-type domain-containing protein n=2 Tax=Rotaria magnacalcarata TaxID=392030 RepID=A0A816UXH8_9BILA|nr:unnamed protein product [Rotaria magnacalcarata]